MLDYIDLFSFDRLPREYLWAIARSNFPVYCWDLGIYIYKGYLSSFPSCLYLIGYDINAASRPQAQTCLIFFVLASFQTEVENSILQHFSVSSTQPTLRPSFYIDHTFFSLNTQDPWPHTSFHDLENNSFRQSHYLAFLFQHCLPKIYIQYFYTPICFHFPFLHFSVIGMCLELRCDWDTNSDMIVLKIQRKPK